MSSIEQAARERARSEQLDDTSEDGLALAFVEQYRGELLFDHSAGTWHRWSGTHWAREDTRLAFHWSRELCRALNVRRKPKLSSVATAAAVERFAQADRAFAVTADAFDRDPWLLGTPGGVVDLRAGTLRESQREDRITKQTAVEVAPAGIVPERWLRFLAEACGGDGALMGFLQRVTGYALTGDVREHALFFVYGPGGNGKGVFVNTVSAILGDYAVTAAMDTFTAMRGQSHPTDLAMLRGARLVSASETEEGHAWAEARIKSITGGDPITARFMRKDFFTFAPHFKLVIVGNHKPLLRNVDDAVRRRFHIVPFTHRPAAIDQQLEQKLKAEWPAILRWMLDGCREWQRQGLAAPPVVTAATATYFDDQDLFGHWLEDCCDLGAQRRATHAELFRSWTAYAAANGDTPGSAKAFTDTMRKRGFDSVRKIGGQSVRGFMGLALKPPQVATHWQERGDG
jgi:putative DNA primase/helicase